MHTQAFDGNLVPQNQRKCSDHGIYFRGANPHERTRPPCRGRIDFRHNQMRQAGGTARAVGGRETFILAARFCTIEGSTLCAGDALHLAVASLGGQALAALVARMRDEAEAVGVRVVV